MFASNRLDCSSEFAREKNDFEIVFLAVDLRRWKSDDLPSRQNGRICTDLKDLYPVRLFKAPIVQNSDCSKLRFFKTLTPYATLVVGGSSRVVVVEGIKKMKRDEEDEAEKAEHMLMYPVPVNSEPYPDTGFSYPDPPHGCHTLIPCSIAAKMGYQNCLNLGAWVMRSSSSSPHRQTRDSREMSAMENGRGGDVCDLPKALQIREETLSLVASLGKGDVT
ncbi:hypothetical protein V8G54_017067 [Vigna mungo]|uniref:Uncharacterized protein n=1 Tax=Vigna mungo TaxID=3915 RepID=A0AAQ3NNU3_VIGMU